MDEKRLRELLGAVRSGDIALDDAISTLRRLPYDDLGFAKLDNHRSIRQGFPEVVYCQGKAPQHVLAILRRMAEGPSNTLATRVSPQLWQSIHEVLPDASYNELARTVSIWKERIDEPVGNILILSAGTADLPVAEEAFETANIMGNHVERLYDVGVAGIHRLFDNVEVIQTARVLVVVAGMEGALASVVGGLVDKPVVAVPTSIGYGASFHGLAALLAMLNSCAAGMAVVNIDNGFGAGYMASLINHM